MLSKRVVIALVILAIILALVSISLNSFSAGKEVSTTNPSGAREAAGQGKVGIEILPPIAEDKNG
ncbi:MAG: hypothetical protein NT116_03625 [Candidatus Parcubacteria bacterium]|nr:hypothetical protein [Candidatus Parcubacteria bacterium]